MNIESQESQVKNSSNRNFYILIASILGVSCVVSIILWNSGEDPGTPVKPVEEQRKYLSYSSSDDEVFFLPENTSPSSPSSANLANDRVVLVSTDSVPQYPNYHHSNAQVHYNEREIIARCVQRVKDSGIEKECVICQEDYKDADDIEILPCAHYFHTTCANTALNTGAGRCPMCRAVVESRYKAIIRKYSDLKPKPDTTTTA